MLWVLLLLVLLPGLAGCGESPKTEVAAFDTAHTATLKFTPSETWEPLSTSPILTLPTASPSPASATRAPATLTRQPTHTATPSPFICLESQGRIEKFSLKTDLLRLPLEYRVYLPPCYEAQRERRYPVLYLFHGQSFADDQWDRIGVDEAADQLIAAGQIPPLIIVMPHDRYGGQPIETGFAQAVVEVLVSKIDRNYRTLRNRLYRAVGGLSRGAGWAVHFGIAHWEDFGVLGAHSPAVFHSDAQRMRTMLDEIPPAQYPRIYMDIGERDRPEILRSAVWFEELLNEKDIPHEWHLFTGYHSEAYWSEHLEQYLLWYTKTW